MTFHLIVGEHALVLYRLERDGASVIRSAVFTQMEPGPAFAEITTALQDRTRPTDRGTRLLATVAPPVVQSRSVNATPEAIASVHAVPHRYFLETSDRLAIATLPSDTSDVLRIFAVDQNLLVELESLAQRTGVLYEGLAVSEVSPDAEYLPYDSTAIAFPRSPSGRSPFRDVPPIRRTALLLALLLSAAVPIVGVPYRLSTRIARSERSIADAAIAGSGRARMMDAISADMKRVREIEEFRAQRHSALLDLASIEIALPPDAALAVFHSDSTGVVVTMIAQRTAAAVEHLASSKRFRDLRMLGAVSQDAGASTGVATTVAGSPATSGVDRITVALTRVSADGGR